jgi:hypothetical protein
MTNSAHVTRARALRNRTTADAQKETSPDPLPDTEETQNMDAHEENDARRDDGVVAEETRARENESESLMTHIEEEEAVVAVGAAPIMAEVVNIEEPVQPGLAASAPAKRGRGRPRKNDAPIPLTQSDLPEMDFSLTVVAKGKHCPPLWMQQIYDWSAHYGTRCSVSLERGGKAEHLHVQAIVTLMASTEKAHIELLKKSLKETLGVKRGDGSKWCVPRTRSPAQLRPRFLFRFGRIWHAGTHHLCPRDSATRGNLPIRFLSDFLIPPCAFSVCVCPTLACAVLLTSTPSA